MALFVQQQQQPSSIPIALMLTIVFLLMMAPFYSGGEDPYLLIATQAIKGVRLWAAVLIPLCILVAVSLQSSNKNNNQIIRTGNTVPFSQVGGSSLGVAFMLVFVMALIWYQPSM